MLLVATLVGVGVAHVLGLVLIPFDRLRGWTIGLVVLAASLGSAPAAPTQVRECVIWGSTLALGLALLAKREPSKPQSSTRFTILLFFGTSLVVSAVALPGPLPALFRIALLGILVALVVSQFSLRDRGAALSGIVWAAMLQATFGLYEFFSRSAPLLWGYGQRADGTDAIYESSLIDGMIRVQGTVGHPIPYATLLAFASIVLAVQWRSLKSVTRFVAVTLFGLGLVLSGTRSALLAIVVALCYLLLLSRYSAHRGRNYLAAFVLVGAALAFSERIQGSITAFVNSGSFENRAGGLESVPGLLSRPPLEVLFGSGWGSEPILFANGYLQQNGFNVVDNQLITTLATQGIVGLFLLLAVFTIAFSRADAGKRSLILVMVVMAFSFDYLRWPAVAVLLFIALALPPATPARPDGPPVLPALRGARSV